MPCKYLNCNFKTRGLKSIISSIFVRERHTSTDIYLASLRSFPKYIKKSRSHKLHPGLHMCSRDPSTWPIVQCTPDIIRKLGQKCRWDLIPGSPTGAECHRWCINSLYHNTNQSNILKSLRYFSFK